MIHERLRSRVGHETKARVLRQGCSAARRLAWRRCTESCCSRTARCATRSCRRWCAASTPPPACTARMPWRWTPGDPLRRNHVVTGDLTCNNSSACRVPESLRRPSLAAELQPGARNDYQLLRVLLMHALLLPICEPRCLAGGRASLKQQLSVCCQVPGVPGAHGGGAANAARGGAADGGHRRQRGRGAPLRDRPRRPPRTWPGQGATLSVGASKNFLCPGSHRRLSRLLAHEPFWVQSLYMTGWIVCGRNLSCRRTNV